jgi:hypothetical protein
MQLPRCSRTDFRKSLAKVLCGVVLLVVATTLPAQLQHETDVEPTPEFLSVRMTVAGADVESLFETLRDGMRVRVEYRVRLSYPRNRPFRLLGDRLVREFRPSIEARWDPFLEAYVMVADDETTSVYEDEAAFYSDLFTLADYRIPWTAVHREPGLVVETSAEYTPIVFVPGLSILSLFTANRSESSPWARHILDDLAVAP